MSDMPSTPAEKRALLAQLLKEKARQKKSAYPASDGQRAQWVIHQLDPESPAYHVAFSARIRSVVDPAALRRAIQAVVDRHPTLRTTYVLHSAGGTESRLMQEVHDYQEADFVQTAAYSASQGRPWSDEELYQQATQAYRQPFNLETGPVARWRLFTRSPQPTAAADSVDESADHIFLIVIHHIAVDAWSLWIILEDLRQALQGQRLAPTPPLYSDWARWQAEMLAAPEGQELRDFWLKQLAGDLSPLNLPLDFPRPPVQTYRGASLAFTIPPEQTRRIRALAQAENVTLYMLLLAVYQTFIHRYTGQQDILVGTPTSGRNQSEFQSTVGYFVNPVTLRAILPQPSPTFRQFLAQTRQTVLAALTHQDYPFIRLVENLPLRQSPDRSPVFQCLFNLHNVQRARAVSALLTQTPPQPNPVLRHQVNHSSGRMVGGQPCLSRW